MIPDIFRQLKLPLNEHMRYVQKLVELHMRPIALVEDIVTDSAVRRLINYAGPDLADLMILAKADITSRNEEKKNKFLANFELVEEKFKDIDVKDYKRTFKPSVSGDEIMRIFNIPQGKTVGYFMDNLKKAQLDVEIPHTREAALEYLYQLAEKIDLKPVNPPEE
jgi:poly(A) polymerase